MAEVRGHASESAPVGEISRARLMDVTRGIARWVRLSGSEDEMKAVRYVEGTLSEAGLHTEVLFHDAYISLPGRASLRVLEPEAAELPVITHSMARPTPPEGLEGEVVYVGAGNPEDYADGRARGSVALADGLATPAKVIAAQEGGALALVNVNDRYTHEMIVSPVWGSPSPDDAGRLPRIPVFSVNAETGERLKAWSGSDRGRRAEGGRRDGGRADGGCGTGGRRGTPRLRVRLSAEVDTGWRRTPILVAELPGIEDDFVLFSGHIDSWHYGAMDNGTANATMVEVARILAARAPFRRGLRLCFWSGHSHGRYSGSAWYVDHHWEELFDRCVAHVYIDSVGGRGATVLTEAMAMSELRPIGAVAVRAIAGQVFEGKRVGRSGDQSFVGLGIPSLFMECSEQPPSDDPLAQAFAGLMGGGGRSGGLGWWWHTTEDTIDKIDESFLARDCAIYLTAIHRLLSMPALAFDYGATAREVREELERLERLAGDRLGLGELVRRASALEAEARRAYEAALRVNAAAGAGGGAGGRETGGADGGSHEGAPQPSARGDEARDSLRAFNEAVKRIGRELIPVWYTRAGRFGQDPALPMPRLPLLADADRLAELAPDSDDARMLAVALTRGRNAVGFALREAMAAARRANEAAEGWSAGR